MASLGHSDHGNDILGELAVKRKVAFGIVMAIVPRAQEVLCLRGSQQTAFVILRSRHRNGGSASAISCCDIMVEQETWKASIEGRRPSVPDLIIRALSSTGI